MQTDVFWPPSKQLADWLGVHISTVRRWRREQNAPPAVIMLLSRDLGIFDPKWKGWCVRGALLRSPEGFELSVNALLAIPFMRMHIESLQLENRKLLETKDAGMENQPDATEWDLARVLAG